MIDPDFGIGMAVGLVMCIPSAIIAYLEGRRAGRQDHDDG
jgi:hypothetical protein